MSTALWESVENDDTAALRRILADVVNNERDEQGRPLLHAAVSNGSIEIVEELLRMGANYQTEDQEGFTALHLIPLTEGDSSMELFNLLSSHAGRHLDINATDRRGRPIIFYAVECFETNEELITHLLH